MVIRRGVLALACATALVSTTLHAQKEQQQNTRKLNDAQKKDYAAVQKMVDEVATGKPATNDLSLAWVHEDFMKAESNRQYVPFVVTVDRAKTGSNLSVYWRVVSKAGGEASATGAKKDDKGAKRAEYAYEDYTPLTLPSGTGPARISRAFSAGGGDYDVYVVVKEPTPDKKNAPPAKVSVIKQAVTVPDFWNGELNTSTVMVADRIDPLPAPLTPLQLIERPYAALGTIELTPSIETKRAKSSELSTFMLIYNTKTDSTNKPDVTIEYNFYTKEAAGEKFFNKTTPQSLNGQTLPPQFDLAAGHQLQTGQSVPLASFPEGDYRLEIKITDKVSSKSITRNVNFTVAGS